LTANNVPLAYFVNNANSIAILQMPTGGGANNNVAYDAAGSIQVSGCYTV
jgi:hypothetical protein